MSLSLISARNEISPMNMCVAPHLPALATLDAALQASTVLLEFQYPDIEGDRNEVDLEELHVKRIVHLSEMLRKELLEYYETIQDGS